MATKKNAVQLNLSVTLNPAAFDFLEKNSPDGDVSGRLAGWTQHWMELQSRGGLMLSPDDHDYISTLNDGKRFKDSRALALAVAKGLKRDEGQFSFTISIDPAFMQPIEELAKESGLTTAELVQNSCAMIWSMNWLYDCTPAEGRMIPFTRKMLEEVAAICGKKTVESTDIGNLIAGGQLIPLSQCGLLTAKRLTSKLEVTAIEIEGMMDELEALRKEVAARSAQPKELVAA